MDYNESTLQLVCFAYLQRVLNGGADSLSREYALGRRRLDLNVRYEGVNYPVEFKLKVDKQFSELKGKAYLEQLSNYMDKLEAKEGWLIIFDRD